MNLKPSWLLTGGIVLAALGGLCLVNSFVIKKKAAEVPRITLAELAKNGPGPEGYATITDVKLATRGHAFWRDAESPDHIQLYVPVFAGNLPQEPDPPDLAYVLAIHDVDLRDRLVNGRGPQEITCLALKNADRVEDWAQTHLSGKYPGLRWANVGLLVVGLHEPTPEAAASALYYGIGLVVVGAGLLAWFAWHCGAGVPPA